MISLRYPLELDTLVDACLIFIEDKTFLKVMLKMFNVLAYTLLGLYAFKAVQIGLSMHDGGMLVLVVGWLAFRRRINRWFLYKRLSRFPMINRQLQVKLQPDGIHWEAGKDVKGHFAWPDIKYVIRVSNGYIFPARSGQYLWTPATAFEDEPAQQGFEEYLKEQGLNFRHLPLYCGKPPEA